MLTALNSRERLSLNVKSLIPILYHACFNRPSSGVVRSWRSSSLWMSRAISLDNLLMVELTWKWKFTALQWKYRQAAFRFGIKDPIFVVLVPRAYLDESYTVATISVVRRRLDTQGKRFRDFAERYSQNKSRVQAELQAFGIQSQRGFRGYSKPF